MKSISRATGVVLPSQPWPLPRRYDKSIYRPTGVALPLAFFFLPFSFYAFTKNQRLSDRAKGNPWACGYAYEQDMAASAGSFTRPLRTIFKSLYTLREVSDTATLGDKGLQADIKGANNEASFSEEQKTIPIA